MGKYALLLVLALGVSVMMYNLGINTNAYHGDVRNVESFSYGQARNIAQSAAQVALAKLMDENDTEFKAETNEILNFPNDGISFASWPQLEGEYRFSVHNQQDSLVVVLAAGRYNDAEYEVRVNLRPETGESEFPDLDKAVFVQDTIEMDGSSKIVGHAGTNSTAHHAIKFSGWSARVDSNLYLGPGGNPDYVVYQANHQSGNVSGDILTLTSPRHFPMPEFPEFPSKDYLGSNVTVQGNEFRVLEPSEYDGIFIPVINVRSNTTLQINLAGGDRVMHVRDFDISQGHVHLNGSGTLTLYVEDKVELGGSSSVNATGNIDQLFIYYAGTSKLDFAGSTTLRGGIFAETADVEIGGSNGIEGHIITGGTSVLVRGNAQAFSRVIYAPNALVDLRGSGLVTGAVVAKDFISTGNARVYFNPHHNSDLPDLNFGSGGTGLYSILSWN